MKITRIFLGTLFALMVFVPQYSTAQESSSSKKEQRKLEKERKKQAKEATSLAERQQYAEMLQNKYFVFMANTLSGDAGATFSVTPKFNFLGVYGDKVVFQFAFDGIVGWNGIGGVTLSGETEDYRFEPGKNSNKPMRVNSRVKTTTHWGKPYFTLTVFEEGYASITMSLKGTTVSMTGQLVRPEESGVYEGSEILIDR